MRPLLGALALSALTSCTPSGGTAYAGPLGERQPVVVELFSSEGCSSCPPADRVLAALANTQPVPGAEVIALELHVDYWNYLGWSDPFSSAAFSGRQRAYAGAFGQRGVYTPQMVVDGKSELLGSDLEGARNAIAAAAKAPRAKVVLARKDDRVTVAVTDLPEPTEPATVWLAITEDNLRTDVPRGENGGSVLAHGPVVRRLSKIGAIAAGSRMFAGDGPTAIEPTEKRQNLRAVVFVQRDRSLGIAGAGSISLR